MRRALLVVVALAATFVVQASAGASAGVYVALGDSYTAGPVIPNQIVSAVGCLRSDHNYPHLIASAIVPSAFRDASCSGAQTKNMTQSQSVTGGTNAPQFNRLSMNTALVTLQIGGNDIGFSDIVIHCVAVLPWGSPCKNKYVKNGVDAIANAINATAPRIGTVIDGIHARSPYARVFVLGYPAILPDTGGGCWPTMPFTSSDVSYLRSKEKQLNATIQWEAGTHHAIYVDVYTASIGHNACSGSNTRWVEPIVPGHLAAPVHPNATGMKGMAAVVRWAMGL
jgi:hypothetical protein